MPSNTSGKSEARMFWLSVKNISEGLFPTECTVELVTSEGNVEVFVSRQQVDQIKQALRVMVLDQDAQFALVQIPGQGSVAKVPRAGLLSAA